jgi:hypothetical protein
MVIVRARVFAVALAVLVGLLGAAVSRAETPVLTVVLDHDLNRPTALAFDPRDGSIWVVNYAGDSTTVVSGVDVAPPTVRRFRDYSDHYLDNPTAIAFSPTRSEFATTGDSRNDYNGRYRGNDFMGPTLWTSMLADFDGGTRSHLDMLHHSPLAMGITAGLDSERREYWVFNGRDQAIDRYFFNEPHQLGGTDHRDGQTYRYARTQLRRVRGVPGHLALDPASQLLYIADTGRGRIAVLDTRASLRTARPIPRSHAETPLLLVPNRKLRTLARGFTRPAGLVLVRGRLVVGDYATGVLTVLRLDGTLETRFDTGVGPNALTGMAFGPDGALYFLDARRNRLLRLEASSLLP